MHANLKTLTLLLRSMGEDFETEYRFHDVREWRFDIAIPRLRVAIEYNGHGQTGRNSKFGLKACNLQALSDSEKLKEIAKKNHFGRHASIIGMSKDCEKLNQAQALGWIVLQFTALHFDMDVRMKNKLTSPRQMLENVITSARQAL